MIFTSHLGIQLPIGSQSEILARIKYLPTVPTYLPTYFTELGTSHKEANVSLNLFISK